MTEFAPNFSVQVNGLGLKTDVAASVTDIEIASEPDTLDHCQLTLANPYPRMRWTHDSRDADVFKEGNALEVRLGYGNTLEPMFDGEITKISPEFPESGTPTVRIEALTRLHRLRGAPKTRTFLGKTDGEIVQEIANDLHLQLDADDPGVPHDYVMQYNQTDLAFLLERAHRVRYAIQVDGRKLCFKKSRESEQPELMLAYGAAPDSPPNARSLRSFAPTMNALKPVDQVTVRGHDARTHEPIEARAGARDADASLGGKTAGATVTVSAFGSRNYTVVDQPVASQSEADALAGALFTERAMQFVTGRGTAVGMPALNAGRVIQLFGLGRFSGRYYVTQSTHRLGAGGYVTAFTVRSDSLS